MKFTLRYAKQALDQSFSIYGQQGSIPKDQLLSYLTQNGGIDVLGIFNATQENLNAPSKYLVKCSLMAGNHIEGFDIDFPLVLNSIAQLFEDKRAAKPADPEATYYQASSFTKQELLNQLHFFAAQNNLTDLHATKLEMVLSDFLIPHCIDKYFDNTATSISTIRFTKEELLQHLEYAKQDKLSATQMKTLDEAIKQIMLATKNIPINHSEWNNVAKQFDSKPILIHWIDQQFENIKITIPFAPTLSKQNLSSLLKQFAIQRQLSKSQIESLESTLKSILSETVSDLINRTEWEKISKKHSHQPIVYEFTTLDEVEAFLASNNHEVIEELPEFVSGINVEKLPAETDDLIKLSEKNSFFTVNDEESLSRSYFQLEVEEKEQTAFEYFYSWITWQPPEKYLKDNEATTHQSLFSLLEAGQQTWKMEAKRQLRHNALLFIGITALIATPALIYIVNRTNPVNKNVLNQPLLPKISNKVKAQNHSELKTDLMPRNQTLSSKLNVKSSPSCTIHFNPGGEQLFFRTGMPVQPAINVYTWGTGTGCEAELFGVRLQTNTTGMFIPGQVIVTHGGSGTASSDGKTFSYVTPRTAGNVEYMPLRTSVIYSPNLLSERESLTTTFSVEALYPPGSNVVANRTDILTLVKTNIVLKTPIVNARPGHYFKPYDLSYKGSVLLHNEHSNLDVSPSAPVFSGYKMSGNCSFTSSNTSVSFPWQNGNSIPGCINSLETKTELQGSYIFKNTIIASAPAYKDVDSVSVKVNIKLFSMNKLTQANSFCRENFPCQLFSYSDPQETNEIFLNETLTAKSNETVDFSNLPEGNGIWSKMPNGVSNNKQALTSTGLSKGLNSLEGKIKEPVNVSIQLDSATGQSVKSKSFPYNMAKTLFDLNKKVYFSESGVTHISGKNNIPARGNTVLLSNEILVLKGSILSYLKEDNCPFELGESDTTRIIKGPLTVKQFNNCIKSMVFSKPKGLLNAAFYNFDLQGDIIHEPSGKAVNIGFALKFKFDIENYAAEIGIGSILSAILTALGAKAIYQNTRQKYANQMSTHPYGKKAAEKLAFLLKIPPVLHNDVTNDNCIKAVLHLKDNVDLVLKNKDDRSQASSSSSSTRTANSYGFDFIISLCIVIREHFNAKQQSSLNIIEEKWAFLKLRFRDEPDATITVKTLTQLINHDLNLGAEEHVNKHSKLAESIVALLPKIKLNPSYADLLKILRQANKLLADGYPASYTTARNACYRLPQPTEEELGESNYIEPLEGTYLGPKGITVIPPRSAVKAGKCLSKNASAAWNALPSREDIKGGVICLVTVNHCCNFFGSAAQGREILNEDSETAELLPKGSSSTD